MGKRAHSHPSTSLTFQDQQSPAYQPLLTSIGPLQLVNHVVQKHLAGEQETDWDKTNKELTLSKMVIFFVCFVSVRFLLTSKVFWYHVTDEMQRVHLLQFNCVIQPQHPLTSSDARPEDKTQEQTKETTPIRDKQDLITQYPECLKKSFKESTILH